jgi:hypothetical protein
MKISDNDLLMLIQSYESIGSKRSIQQNQILTSLNELQQYRNCLDKLINNWPLDRDSLKELLKTWP